ncbi:MAG: Dehydrosqualene desaturase [Acidimicrobiales bacterium]|nr:MAG: NAD(P)/FAD-dependent oxidoreductase [Actinomycetota bacterium]MBV6508065.1 Dehydrosqualene desaturase [Acidimicrobiales bacterium]RIK05309.1 MAG: hypothetical protein DCC48_10545 [Acidobacteriota bacterium]
MNASPEILVLGAGPNGLTAAAYLARAGGAVTVLERNIETGGGLVTEELAGFRFNYHATYMMLAELMPPYGDLGLAQRGVEFIRPPEQVSFLFEDDAALTLHTDVALSAASVKSLCPADAPRVEALLQDCATMCDAFLIPASYVPPLEPIDQMVALNSAGALGEKMAAMGDITPGEFVAGYDIEDPRVEAALLYLIAMFGLDPDEGGLGFLAPIYLYRLTQAALVRGGSHQLSSVLRRVVEDAGGSVVVDADVRELLWDGARVTGVSLADGTALHADAVLSTLNPAQNFLELGEDLPLDPMIRASASDWEWERTSLFVANLGVVGAAPRYEGYPAEVDRSLNVVMGYETPADVHDHLGEVASGSLTSSAGHGTVCSLHDPLMAPGHVPFGEAHTLRYECLAPYDVDWDSEAEAFASRCIDLWARYAPNLRDANVRASLNWTPADIEAHLPTMRRGSIKHGSYAILQMGYNRPNPECSGYRTPLDGLYLGGASTHPGGMVILGAGYNAARVLAGDLGLDIWWSEPEIVTSARAAGYLGD